MTLLQRGADHELQARGNQPFSVLGSTTDLTPDVTLDSHDDGRGSEAEYDDDIGEDFSEWQRPDC